MQLWGLYRIHIYCEFHRSITFIVQGGRAIGTKGGRIIIAERMRWARGLATSSTPAALHPLSTWHGVVGRHKRGGEVERLAEGEEERGIQFKSRVSGGLRGRVLRAMVEGGVKAKGLKAMADGRLEKNFHLDKNRQGEVKMRKLPDSMKNCKW